MLGFSAISEAAISALPDRLSLQIAEGSKKASLVVSSLIIPSEETYEGVLVGSTSALWHRIIRELGNDWSVAFQISSRQWEELIAGAFTETKLFDEVVLTPATGDKGRDVIAIKRGVLSIRMVGSVKAYAADNLVRHDDVRALAGVLLREPHTSKGIITTTSDFPESIAEEFAPLISTRLELMNGKMLQAWLSELSDKKKL